MVVALQYRTDLLEIHRFTRFESSLAHLGFRHFQPLASLRPWVHRYFHLLVATNLPQSIEQTFYPDGGTSLQFYFPAPSLDTNSDEPKVVFHCDQSLHSHAFVPGIEQMIVRFHPGGAFHLLGIAVQEIQQTSSHTVIEATQLHLPGLNQLLSQLADTNQPMQRIAQLEQWLLQLIKPQLDRGAWSTAGIVQMSLPRLIQPQTRLENFYGQLALSRRQFERRFKQETGLSPAQLQQLNRVKIARDQLSQSPELNLAQVAFDCGFYDQAHLHQHFVRVTQQTPGQYKKRKMSQISNLTQC